MKKKAIAALVLLIILAFTVGVFTGCDEIFSKNPERDAHQIAASVSYKGQSANIYKFEVQDSFDSVAYYYMQVYGMTEQAAADYIVRSLAQRELLVMFAKEYIAQNVEELGLADMSPELITLRQLLSGSEYNKAIGDTNESMLTSLKSIVKNRIEEDNYNEGKPSDKDDDDDGEITDPITVKFDSDGGSAVENQKIQRGKKADKPVDPTKEGFTFYGWYMGEVSEDNWDEFDFSTPIDPGEGKSKVTLTAKWVAHDAPRPVKPGEEEEDDFDPEAAVEEWNVPYYNDKGVASDAFKAKALEEFKEEDFADDIKGTKTLDDYISDGVAELSKSIKEDYKSYQYFLDTQMKTLLITKLERVIGEDVTVTEEDIQAKFDEVVKANAETFKNSDTSYESALKSALATTYFHSYVDPGYGFVINILLKLDDDSVSELTDMLKAGNVSKENIMLSRDEMLRAMEIQISNPDYDTTEKVDYGKDEDGEDIVIRDPMTDPNNKYNGVGSNKDTTYNKDNDYNNIVSFKYNSEKKSFEIVYNVHEAPSMPYLINEHPAFDKDGKKGIVTQIYESFEAVKNAVTNGVTDENGEGNHKISEIESIYWLREMATAWLYLVGDDEGGTNTESNNGGLGYLVTPEGKDSGFLEPFTEQARALIGKGTGSYTVDGTVNGSYVFADSFIESGNTDSAYAGIFIVFASHSVWDTNAKTFTYNADGTIKYDADGNPVLKTVVLDKDAKTLPLDYIVTYGKTDEDCVTIRDQIKKSLEDSRKSAKYNKIVNDFGAEYSKQIKYFEKVYKSIWKD